jgi:hypothetical protein
LLAPAFGFGEALLTSRQEGALYIKAIDRLFERAETFIDKVVVDALRSAERSLLSSLFLIAFL